MTRWSGEAVEVLSTTVGRLSDALPTFRRTALSADLREPDWTVGGPPTPSVIVPRRSAPPAHKYLDAVMLQPRTAGAAEVPIGFVSKHYSLISHRALATSLSAALSHHIKEAAQLRCDLTLSEYGGRMKLRVHLPSEIEAPDGEKIEPTLECLNSVDRSRPLEIYLGWFRLVCSNGLILGDEFARVKRRHVNSLELRDVQAVVSASLGRLTRDADLLQMWRRTPINEGVLKSWVDGPVSESWGVQAATRVFHAAQTGHDCRVRGAQSKVPASERRVDSGAAVPGSVPPNCDAYRLSQILAFVAARRNELEAVQERLIDIPRLIKHIAPAPQSARGKSLEQETSC